VGTATGCEPRRNNHRAGSEPSAPDILPRVSTIGIDVGKNTFHLVAVDKRGAIVLQQKVTRHQLGRRLSNIPA